MYQAGSMCRNLRVISRLFKQGTPMPVLFRHGLAKKTISRQICSAIQRPRGVVYESVSNDIYTNLAFEDWLYNNLDLGETNVLVLWRNNPCVVIGRHQNPWAECNLRQLWGSKVRLARRRSGGGTVYHDLGNLNCTFFTARSRYDRRGNLDLTARALRSHWPGLNIDITCRDDILLDNFYKVSGSSSKLGRQIAYHHCTLLHGVNTVDLGALLHCEKAGMTHKATQSVRSAVKNLSDVDPSIAHRALVDAISGEFYNCFPALYENRVYPVDPLSETDWPGTRSLRKELMCWEWLYGKTPKFSVQRSQGVATVLVHVSHARIQGVVLQAPPSWVDIGLVQELTERLAGKRFWPDDIAEATEAYLAQISVDPDTRRRLELTCELVQEAMS